MIFKKYFYPDAPERFQICASGVPWDKECNTLWLSLGGSIHYSHPSHISKGKFLCITLSFIVDVSFWLILKREPTYSAKLQYPIHGKSLFFYYLGNGECRAYRTKEEYLKDKHPVTLDILDTE